MNGDRDGFSRRRALGLFVVVAGGVAFPQMRVDAAPDGMATASLAVLANGRRHEFTVEVALTPEQKARGLMYRRRLAPGHGMLFLYAHEQEITMWMKNTLIPLDMLFIGADRRIVHVHERAVPGSLAAISSREPARAVLEVAGGTASRLGIGVGDRVLYDGPGAF